MQMSKYCQILFTFTVEIVVKCLLLWALKAAFVCVNCWNEECNMHSFIVIVVNDSLAFL